MKGSKQRVSSCILIVDDVPANLSLLIDLLEAAGHRVVAAPDGEVALRIAPEARPDLILMDVMMPELDGFETCRRLKQLAGVEEVPVLFLTARDEPQDVEEGFRAGGVDYIPKPFRAEEALLRVETHLRLRRLTCELREKNAALEEEIRRRDRAERERDRSNARLETLAQQEAERWGVPGLIGQSPTFRRILETIRKAAGLGTSRVLILGESGTGKELLARAIHFAGPRSRGPFVAVNCSAIPGELAESLFFGHVKGAFTGATSDRPGYFELANGGTLFLDEISELPLPLQPKLLRVLDETEITPVGALRPHPVQANIVAASNADFSRRIAQDRFRPDLYFRLARFTVEVPPLRDRREDIPLLAHHFIQLFSSEMNLPRPRVPAATLQALVAYDYPGNVRELKNLIERAVMEAEGGDLREEHLHFFALHPGAPVGDGNPGIRTPGPAADAVEEEARIRDYLRTHPTITNSESRRVLGTDRHHAGYVLHRLTEQGVLVCNGHRRWARYRLA